jgi:hypothetical protein
MPNFRNVICLWIRHLHIINQKRVQKYFEENKDVLNPVYLPTTASTEFMVMEEIWNLTKRDLFVMKYYGSFADLKNKISQYFRTKRFHLNIRNYLLLDVI